MMCVNGTIADVDVNDSSVAIEYRHLVRMHLQHLQQFAKFDMEIAEIQFEIDL